ncbi:MAG: aminotransferase class V-fold PLP-dependent enzyme [Nitrospirae bacterium]|nr:aminotransferase class V-fold PLP-dependent enzyme [Nitrospirota bacterium]
MIYLNYAALSPTRPEAERTVTETLNEFKNYLYSDAGIQWYLHTVQDCRLHVARLLNVTDPSTIAFVSNASIAHYLTLRSLAWKPGDSILTTTHENPSITRQLHALKDRGVDIHFVQPSSPDQLIQSITHTLDQHSVKAIVISHVSHVDGRIFPIHAISGIAKERGVAFIVDGAQAVGHIPVDLNQLDCDVYFFTGHKWCAGPLGTGAMMVSDRFLQSHSTCAVQIKDGEAPLATQFEIGTHNIGLISGLAKACDMTFTDGLGVEILQAFRQKAKETLSQIPGVNIVGWNGPHAPGIFTIQGKPEVDHYQLTKRLANEYEIIVKPFVDYPQEIRPAIRLSWATTMNEQNFRVGIEKISEGFS